MADQAERIRVVVVVRQGIGIPFVVAPLTPLITLVNPTGDLQTRSRVVGLTGKDLTLGGRGRSGQVELLTVVTVRSVTTRTVETIRAAVAEHVDRVHVRRFAGTNAVADVRLPKRDNW